MRPATPQVAGLFSRLRGWLDRVSSIVHDVSVYMVAFTHYGFPGTHWHFLVDGMTSLSNKFGHFGDSGRAFTITDPQTPMPWVNVICNGRYGLVISQNGGGFSWFDDAQHNVLTRWEMDLVKDASGKFLYLADRDSGDIWSATPAPCRTKLDEYSCTHTQGLTTFTTAAHGIRTSWTLTVAPEDAVEVWAVEITNTSDRPRRLRLSSYLDWCCGVAPDSKREFHRLFFTTKHDKSRRAILATKNMWDIPPKSEKDHWNQPWPYVAAHAVCGTFDSDLAIADKNAFLGKYGAPEAPKAMKDAKTASGGFGRFGDAAAALGGDFTLEPGATLRVHYLLAIAPDEKGVISLLDLYSTPAAAQKAVEEAEIAWDQRLRPTQVQTDREDFDLLNNHWLPYQAISGRLWGRTGYYQQSGARGFRDQLQDSQVWLPLDPSKTLDQIKLHATRQFQDGSVNHWWHALADFGNRTACSDDYLWLPFVTASYIRETGDLSPLGIEVPFMDSGTPVSLLEHCRRSFARSFKRTSARGLPFIGSCDWNDGLSAMGIEEKGESVWLGMFLCQLLADWAVILDRTGARELAAEFKERREALAKAINAHAWDQPAGALASDIRHPKTGWYRYGTKDSGEWVGELPHCARGKIISTLRNLGHPVGHRPARACPSCMGIGQRTPALAIRPAHSYSPPPTRRPTPPSSGTSPATAPAVAKTAASTCAAAWALAAAAKIGDAEAVLTDLGLGFARLGAARTPATGPSPTSAQATSMVPSATCPGAPAGRGTPGALHGSTGFASNGSWESGPPGKVC